jgi:hypothetical protein
MYKKLAAFLVFVVAFFVFERTTLALQVTCSDTTTPHCTLDSSAPLFSAQNIYPGWSTSQTIRAINNYDEDRLFGFEIFNLTSTPLNGVNLAETLVLIIKDGTEEKWNQKLINSVGTYISLTKVPEQGHKDYTIEIKMDEAAGNEYQNKRSEFDIRIGFEAKEISGGGGGSKEGGIGGRGGSNEEPEEILGVQTVTLLTSAPLTTATPTPTGAIAGTTSEPEIQKASVAGTEDVACIDPWWWFLVFLLQILLHVVVRFIVDKSSRGSVAIGLIYQVVAALVFAAIFLRYFCPSWDIYVSVLISLIALVLQRKSVQSLV